MLHGRSAQDHRLCAAGGGKRLLQQLFNAADVAVVGRFAGLTRWPPRANTYLISLMVNLFVGVRWVPSDHRQLLCKATRMV
jgi:hypothetical protein